MKVGISGYRICSGQGLDAFKLYSWNLILLSLLVCSHCQKLAGLVNMVPWRNGLKADLKENIGLTFMGGRGKEGSSR